MTKSNKVGEKNTENWKFEWKKSQDRETKRNKNVNLDDTKLQTSEKSDKLVKKKVKNVTN